MKKTYCDRCGKEIYYDPRQQAILPTYNISYTTYGYYQPNHFDLCGSCQIEFNSWMEKWLKEKEMKINLFLLIIWIICGVLTFISAATSGDHRVSVLSYACCWAVLIMQLIAQL